MKIRSNLLSLILWYLPVLLVQIISSKVTFSSLSPWFRQLKKATWSPPNWLFGPVWTLLYLMMTVSVWLIYKSGNEINQKKIAYYLFFTQLILNGIWSILFFGLHKTGWALIDLGFLIAAVLVMTICYFKLSKAAGFLLIPYLIWIIYAFTLNAAIFQLN